MAEVKVLGPGGEAAGTLAAPERLAAAQAKVGLVHQVAVAELAGRRQGTSNTLRRDMVRGSGVKIRRQKGTGRSRQGDKRVPHMRGGGIVHGPHPRSYAQNTPRKMRQAAFLTALNSRLQNELLWVWDAAPGSGKTKELAGRLATLGLADRKVLLLTTDADGPITMAARNLRRVQVQSVNQTSLVDVLGSDVIVCTRGAWGELEERVAGGRTRDAVEESGA